MQQETKNYPQCCVLYSQNKPVYEKTSLFNCPCGIYANFM